MPKAQGIVRISLLQVKFCLLFLALLWSSSGCKTFQLRDCARLNGQTQCHWRMGHTRYCGGIAPPKGWTSKPRCICDGCQNHSDCKAQPGGRCIMVKHRNPWCHPSAMVCVYAKDKCPPKTANGRRQQWLHRGRGRAVCGLPAQPIPRRR